MLKKGVRRDRNERAEGRTLERGEVTRLSSAAIRPTSLTEATMREPRQTLPKDVPVAR